MSSSPSLLKSQGLLELAVKTSSWAPANWVHTKCTVQSPQPPPSHVLVLVLNP